MVVAWQKQAYFLTHRFIPQWNDCCTDCEPAFIFLPLNTPNISKEGG
jgi:hypothetical protein